MRKVEPATRRAIERWLWSENNAFARAIHSPAPIRRLRNPLPLDPEMDNERSGRNRRHAAFYGARLKKRFGTGGMVNRTSRPKAALVEKGDFLRRRHPPEDFVPV